MKAIKGSEFKHLTFSPTDNPRTQAGRETLPVYQCIVNLMFNNVDNMYRKRIV